MPDSWLTPDDLDELDRRVYELAVQHIPLAEIAVRLGVPVPQADEKLQRLYTRLGVSNRDELRALGENAVEVPFQAEAHDSVGVEDGYVIGADSDGVEIRRFTRRGVLTAGLIVGVLGLSGAAALVLTRKGAKAPEIAAPDDQSATREPGLAVPITAVPYDETWGTQAFLADELIDWPHGLFLMRIASGNIRAYRLRTSEGLNYQTFAGGRFIAGSGVTQRDSPPRSFLMDSLNTERAWAWSPEEIRLITAVGDVVDALLIFEILDSNRGTGRLLALRIPRAGDDLEPAFELTVPATGFTTPVLLSPDRSSIAVVSAAGPRLVVTVLDATTGEVRGTYDPGLIATSADAGFALDAFQLVNDDYFLLAWHYYLQGRGDWLRGLTMNFRWDGGGATEPTFHDHAASFSADGKLYVREVALRNVTAEGADGPREYWPAVEIVETSSGKVLGRVRSAAIYYGDGGPARRWLGADAFVALLRTTQLEDGHDFGIISARTASGTSNVVQRYPFVPDSAFEGMWFQSAWAQGMVPSPDSPQWVALGKFAALELPTGAVVKANVRNDSGPAHIDPWSAGPNWLTFALPHLGHGGASPPVLLQPKFESPETPIESPLRFKVSAQGDRLNLRDQPSLAGNILAALEDGTTLTQAESSDPSRPRGLRGLEQGNNGTWVYVTAPGGIEGWVNSAYLAWP